MATATFAERIQDDLAVLISDPTMIDLSRQRNATATEDTTKTIRVAQMAAAKVESRLGSAGSYDDTDGTVGKQIFLDFGVRIALMRYSQVYSLVLTDAGRLYIGSVNQELEEYRMSLVQEASNPVVASHDNDEFNQRHDGPNWDDDDDD